MYDSTLTGVERRPQNQQQSSYKPLSHLHGFSGAASQHNGRFKCGKSAATPYSVDIKSVVLTTVTCSTGKYKQLSEQPTEH